MARPIKWLSSAVRDLVRLYDFLKDVNPRAAAKTVQTLVQGAKQLSDFAHMGQIHEEFAPREVRALVIGDYELRYEVKPEAVIILRIWHCREDR